MSHPLSHSIYLDHAASTPLRDSALSAYLEVAQLPGNAASVHQVAQRLREYLEEGRSRVAAGLGVDARALVISSGGTEANNQVIHSAAQAFQQGRGRAGHLISTPTEHASVLAPLRYLEQQGWTIQWLTPDRHGRYDPAELAALLRPETALVSIQHINNELGTIQPTAELAALARAKGIPYHCDAVQAPGIAALPLLEWEVTYATISAHKWGGPKGVGFTYVQRGQELRPLHLGGGQEGGLRPGTQDAAAIYAAGVAFNEAEAQREQTWAHLSACRERLLAGLTELDGVVHNHPPEGSPKLLNLSFAEADGEALLLNLDLLGVAASAGSACSAGTMQPSHVLLALGLSAAQARASLRLSFGIQTNLDEVERAAQAIRQAVEWSRG